MLTTLGLQEWGAPTSCTLVRIGPQKMSSSNLSQPESGRLRWWLTFAPPEAKWPQFGCHLYLRGSPFARHPIAQHQLS